MDLNQVSLGTQDFTASLEFYRTLGLKLIVLNEGTYARFELPSGSTTLSIYYADSPAIGDMILYFEVNDVDQRFDELVALGITFDAPPTDQSWLWREAHFSDPAGHRLCLLHAGQNRRFPPWRIDGV